MMIKSKIEKALNKQINVELNAFYSYLSMSVYFESSHMPGFAQWFKIQSNEEFKHAVRFKDYMIARGGQIHLMAVETPKTEWKSPLAVFEDAYAQELKVSTLINDLVDLAKHENDHATEIMLQWFVTEQVEEENTASNNIEKLKFVKNNTEGVVELDHELGQRK